MKLEGKRFVLRRPRSEDAEVLWGQYHDPEIKRNMVKNLTKKDFVREWGQYCAGKVKDADWFVVDVSGQAVGKISLRGIVPKLKGTVASWIGKEFRGKGIMTEAKILAGDYWFEKYGLKRIEARTREYNKGAQKSLEKSGFVLEGVLRKNVLKNGKYYNDCLYAKIK